MEKTRAVYVGIINYNGEKTLPGVIERLLKQRNVSLKIRVYDNRSTDRSLEVLKNRYPRVGVEVMARNRGPSPSRNAALGDSRSEYTLLMDNDIYFDPDGLDTLVGILESNPDCMACGPLIAYNSDPDSIQYNGIRIHYIGAAIIGRGGIGDLRSRTPFKSICLSAGALLVRTEVVERTGLFDEDFHFGWEDGDFTFRITAAGFDCIAVPGVVVFHDAGPRDPSNVYYQVRNRWFFILKNYSPETIFLIFPALILYEIFLSIFLLLKGFFPAYIRANVTVIRNLPILRAKRNRVLAGKSLKDRDLLCSGDVYAGGIMGESRILHTFKSFANIVFDRYWRVIKIALK